MLESEINNEKSFNNNQLKFNLNNNLNKSIKNGRLFEVERNIKDSNLNNIFDNSIIKNNSSEAEGNELNFNLSFTDFDNLPNIDKKINSVKIFPSDLQENIKIEEQFIEIDKFNDDFSDDFSDDFENNVFDLSELHEIENALEEKQEIYSENIEVYSENKDINTFSEIENISNEQIKFEVENKTDVYANELWKFFSANIETLDRINPSEIKKLIPENINTKENLTKQETFKLVANIFREGCAQGIFTINKLPLTEVQRDDCINRMKKNFSAFYYKFIALFQKNEKAEESKSEDHKEVHSNHKELAQVNVEFKASLSDPKNKIKDEFIDKFFESVFKDRKEIINKVDEKKEEELKEKILLQHWLILRDVINYEIIHQDILDKSTHSAILSSQIYRKIF